MRNKFFLLLTALLAIFVFTPNTLAQDYRQWGLPTGAKARLGKGRITENRVLSGWHAFDSHEWYRYLDLRCTDGRRTIPSYQTHGLD